MTYPYQAQSQYMRNPASPCAVAGECRYTDALVIYQQARELVQSIREREAKVNESRFYALWCQEGQHSFGPDDTKRRVLSITAFGPDGAEYTEERLVCGEHLPEIQVRKAITVAVEAREEPF